MSSIYRMIIPALTSWVMILMISVRHGMVDAKIGVNWGRVSTTKMTPSMVVDILLQNNVPAVKIFNSDDDLLKAFAGSGIEVTIGIYQIMEISDVDKASNFVNKKIKPYYPAVNIKNVMIGNNALGNARYTGSNFQGIIDVVNFVQTAINNFGYGNEIKVILSNSYTGVLQRNGTRPSDASFAPDLKDTIMPQLLKHLQTNNAPFVMDLFPIGFVYSPNALFRHFLDPEFGFFDNKSTKVITDINGLEYHNLFDFVHDSFVWAMKKIGYHDIEIKVGQIGWPTDGISGADAQNAERFWKGLLPKVMSNVGTPMRPGAPIDIFIQSLTDEKNVNPIFPFQRHWGIYRANGEPKFKIDLSGKGRDIYPTSAKGLSLMPSRWCVFNGDLGDSNLIRTQVQLACNQSDCTSLYPGGSCGMLSHVENVSYAFNAYFQSNYQAESACNFEGLGKVVVEDPSKGGCVFSVEVVQGTRNGESEQMQTLPAGFVYINEGKKLIDLQGRHHLLVLFFALIYLCWVT